MSLIERLYSVGAIRQFLWRSWYPLLTRRLRRDDLQFLNYAYETEPPMGLALAPEDEPNRASIQLYHHVATQIELRGREVLEVSCGHGGGASYVARTLRPSSYTGLDLNPAGIRFCRERHRVDGLGFVEGDAVDLPFRESSFDTVLNIEASHCYPAFPRFLAEVARVLRPGGHFLYADFRPSSDVAEWERAFSSATLTLIRSRELNAEVVHGMERNASRSLALIARRMPKLLHSLGRDFAGIPGSRVHAALQRHEISYRSYCFEKS